MMVRRILDAHGGTLPDQVFVCFANTGKEREATLRFVHDCATRWDVRVHWLEFVTDLKSVGPAGRFEEVGFNSASRQGEPFDRMITRKQAIPMAGVSGRFCTQLLKVQAMFDFMSTQGFAQSGTFAEAIGLRADEGPRIARLKAKPVNRQRLILTPLADAGIRKADVLDFWRAQDFDLRLARGFGNCDHCPFVGIKDRIARARADPRGVLWWAQHEQARGVSFGHRLSMVEILGQVAQSPELIPSDDADGECGLACTSGGP